MRLTGAALLLALNVSYPFCDSASCAQIHAWRQKLPSLGFTVGISASNPNLVIGEAEPGTLWISFDRGKTWSDKRYPGSFAIRQIIIHPSDTSTIFCASADGTSGLRKS